MRPGEAIGHRTDDSYRPVADRRPAERRGDTVNLATIVRPSRWAIALT